MKLTLTDKVSGSTENIKAKKKNVFVFILKIFIAAGLLIFLVGKVDFKQFMLVISNAKISFLLIAFLLLAVNLYLQFKKWELTCGKYLGTKNRSQIIYSLFAGLSAGTFTPARVGEYFGRAVAFKDKPVSKITVATFIDKFFPLLIVALAGSISSVLFIYFYYHTSILLSAALLAVLFAIFYLVIFLISKPGLLETLAEKTFPDNKRVASFLEIIKHFRNPGRQYPLKMSIFSFLFYLCYIFQFSLLIAAFSGGYDFIHYFWAANLVMFTKSLIPSISFAELGIREGAAVFFLGSMGLTSIVAFNAALSLFFINVLLPSLTGLFFLLKKDHA